MRTSASVERFEEPVGYGAPRKGQRAIAGKAPRHPLHLRQSWQFRICNFPPSPPTSSLTLGPLASRLNSGPPQLAFGSSRAGTNPTLSAIPSYSFQITYIAQLLALYLK